MTEQWREWFKNHCSSSWFIHSGNRIKEIAIVTSIGNIVWEYTPVSDSLHLLAQDTTFVTMAQKPPVGQGPRHYRGFVITLRHTALGRTPWMSVQPEAETSSWQHTTLTRDRHPCPQVGLEPTIPASERPQTHSLDRADTGIGKIWF